MRPPAHGVHGAYAPEGSRKKAKPMGLGNKLIEKAVFKTLGALRHALCPMLYHSKFPPGRRRNPYGPEAAFPLPNSDFCPQTSVFCPLFTDLLLDNSSRMPSYEN